jgi:transcriptional regulator with XRE-family HTH domain
LRQSELADKAEIWLATLKDYEGGRRGPSLEIAQRIAAALGKTCQAFDGCEFEHAKQSAWPKKPRKRKGK